MIKAIPEVREGKVWVREYVYNPKPYVANFTFGRYAAPDVEYNTALDKWKEKEGSLKSYQAHPEHEAYFRGKLGRVVEVTLGATSAEPDIEVFEGKKDRMITVAVPVVDLWEEADDLSDKYADSVYGWVNRNRKDWLDSKKRYLRNNYQITKKL